MTAALPAAPPELDVAPSLELLVPSSIVAARRAAGDVQAFLAQHGLDEAEQFAWELCIAEAAKNAVQYARNEEKETPLHIEVRLHPRIVEARVTDHTEGFDLASWPACLPPNENESGRGLFLMRIYMDKVKYVPGDGANTLVLQKARSR